MDTAPSPAPSSARSLVSDVPSDDEWDMLSETGRTQSAADYDSDREPPHPEYIHDLVSGFSTGDEFDDDDRPFDDAVLRESDRRVNTALANSLSSTLEPFREPLPSFLPASLSNSSEGSGLILSFPDPLTPSQELRSEPTEVAPIPEQQATTDALEDDQGEPASVESAAPATVSDVNAEAVEDEAPRSAEEPEVTPTTDAPQEVVIPKKDAGDLRKIASYVQRKKSLRGRSPRRPAVDALASLLQGPPIPQTWTTSMIISVLVLVLGSALYAARAHTLATTKLVHPSTTTPLAIMPASTPNVDAIGQVPVTTHTSITPLLLQTPGAGPSTPTPGCRKRWGSPSTLHDNEAKAPLEQTAPDAATSTGATRQGLATPLPPAFSGFWSGKGKGKEKEVVEVDNHDDLHATEATTSQTLRLDGPKPPLSLSYIYKDVLNGLKAVLTDQSHTDKRLSLSSFNFEELLDELILRIIDRTSALLRELSSVVEKADALIKSAPVQSAKEAFARHHSRVKHNARNVLKGVRDHHRRAQANARKGLRQASKFKSLVEGVKAHHGRVSRNTRRGCKAMGEGLKAVADEFRHRVGGMEVEDELAF